MSRERVRGAVRAGEALLAADADAPPLLGAPLGALADALADGLPRSSGAPDAFDTPPGVPDGATFGPYRVLRELGRGGMATVANFGVAKAVAAAAGPGGDARDGDAPDAAAHPGLTGVGAAHPPAVVGARHAWRDGGRLDRAGADADRRVRGRRPAYRGHQRSVSRPRALGRVSLCTAGAAVP
ncbi:hypothetical protein tb265_02110 [Gemmatimonadetes bacterium T265]|nr:hypothetical protein tb265_02110 [Gemmatimonadetes bacterium T265]